MGSPLGGLPSSPPPSTPASKTSSQRLLLPPNAHTNRTPALTPLSTSFPRPGTRNHVVMEATTAYPCDHALNTNLQCELREGYPPTYLMPTRILGVKLQSNESSASGAHTTLHCFIFTTMLPGSSQEVLHSPCSSKPKFCHHSAYGCRLEVNMRKKENFELAYYIACNEIKH